MNILIHRDVTRQSRFLCVLLISIIIIAINEKILVDGLIHKTFHHKLYQLTPMKHADLHHLSGMRLRHPELTFWNGIGNQGERVYIMCTEEAAQRHEAELKHWGMKMEVVYKTVHITFTETDPEHPNVVTIHSRLNEYGEASDSEENFSKDPVEKILREQRETEDIEAKISEGEPMDNQEEAEILIIKRKKKYNFPDNSIAETIRSNLYSPGLLPVAPVKSFDGMKDLPINSGLLYRFQGVQTLSQHSQTSVKKGEWTTLDKLTGERTGSLPLLGEYLNASVKKRRLGMNPYMTAEETIEHHNDVYLEHTNKSALWMFVPTEYEKFYEIRNRNYPFSLLVWNYDVEEGEFVVSLETRREFLKRYRPEGILRHRALFAVQMVDETFDWELGEKRPKFYLFTRTANHVYLYESKKKDCTVLIVRNSATTPYQPEKTDKIERPLDLFYITRQDLTGKLTASIFSFMYNKTIVDIVSQSESQNNVYPVVTYEMANRAPLPLTHYVFENVVVQNQYKFKFASSFKGFGWVTIEAPCPSFGISPIINTGVVGNSTQTDELVREAIKVHEIQDKIILKSGHWSNSTVIFQHVDTVVNPFTAMMEVTAPADRMYFDRRGDPRFFRLSLPGYLIYHLWKIEAKFDYDRIIEKREAALVLQISGTLAASYGLRAFIKKTQGEYGPGVASCPPSTTN